MPQFLGVLSWQPRSHSEMRVCQRAALACSDGCLSQDYKVYTSQHTYFFVEGNWAKVSSVGTVSTDVALLVLVHSDHS